MQLSDLVDGTILLTIPKVHPSRWLEVRLRGVEAGGIWIESQELTNQILQNAGASSAPRTPIVFLPYHAISQAVHFVDEPALNEAMLR